MLHMYNTASSKLLGKTSNYCEFTQHGAAYVAQVSRWLHWEYQHSGHPIRKVTFFYLLSLASIILDAQKHLLLY